MTVEAGPGKPPAGFRLGIDIGGTFTDAVLVDDDTGALTIDKVLTTPEDPSLGFIESVSRLRRRTDLRPDHLPAIIHATTVATNALLERRGAETALLVTRGFGDILEIARQVRWELYNLQTSKPPPLVPRRLCFEVPERVDWRGEVLRPLDEDAVRRVAERLREYGIASIAVCLLHAYANASHERRVGEILAEVYPEVSVSLSSAIAPEVREYWRASTTVTNAYIRPIVERYLSRVEGRLRSSGLTSALNVMQSSGGMMSAGAAKVRPISMLESGPAAGVAAAAFIARLAGFAQAISFDMGGTTAKVGLIRDGSPSVRSEFEAGAAGGTGVGLAKGSGYPILAPVMDLVEVGAGGGSIAWIDAGGLPRVGPRSAGADPGPACYGRGGSEPTVTDANLVLGRLQPDHFLGGELALDPDAAHRAIEAHVARPLGLDVVEAAHGILEIANAAMGQAMRLVSVQRGYDPRDFALVAFGGAGPVHAIHLAGELNIPTIAIPPSPGVASALGMLATDLREDFRVTRLQPLEGCRADEIESILEDFQRRAVASFARDGMGPDRLRFERYLDLRYVGQSWRLQVSLPADRLTDDALRGLREEFVRLHERQYGYAVPDEPVEIVTVGLSAFGAIEPIRLRDAPCGDGALPAPLDTRPVYFREAGGFVEAPIHDRYGLPRGVTFAGPAIVVETDATTVLPPGYRAEVSVAGILLVHRVA